MLVFQCDEDISKSAHYIARSPKVKFTPSVVHNHKRDSSSTGASVKCVCSVAYCHARSLRALLYDEQTKSCFPWHQTTHAGCKVIVQT